MFVLFFNHITQFQAFENFYYSKFRKQNLEKIYVHTPRTLYVDLLYFYFEF